MALNNIYVDASPESVYDVLADPRHYANWVMAASATRRFEGRWPERGSVLHHTQMMLINDTTEVLDSERPGRLLLEARARPVVVYRVDISVRPESGGTRVVLEEHPTGGLMAALPRHFLRAAACPQCGEPAPSEVAGRDGEGTRQALRRHRRAGIPPSLG